MIYNGIDLSDMLFVEKVDNPPLPPIEITARSAPGQHGARFMSKRLSARTITIEVALAGSTREEYMQKARRIAEVLYAPDVAPLSGLPGDDCCYYATASKWNMEKLMTIGKGAIEFFCADPFGYGPTRTVPLNIHAVALGNTPANGVITQTVSADLSEDIVFELRGADQFIRLFGPFARDDQIEIDTAKGFAMINGTSAMPRVDIRSSWFACGPGTFRINTIPDSLTGGSFKFAERWL